MLPPRGGLTLQNLQIDAQRLWDTLMETAQIGATPKGGICRLTLTDLDRQVRDWFKAQCEALGCTVTVDEVGNMFARRPGKNPNLAPIAMGSHLDTQPTGGKFDGVLGVLGRARSHAHAARSRLRDQCADRDRQLDQRGRRSFRAGDAGVRRVCRRVHARHTPMRAPIATAKPSAMNWRASATKVRSTPARANFRRCSNCTSSKARSSKPKAA